MQRFLGKYRGICRDNHDPRMVGRIRAEVPYPLGHGRECWSTWAWPCLPPGHFDVPREGDMVWIEFLNGDANAPVWTGVWFAGAGDLTTAPFQATHPAMVDLDGNEADPDKRDHVADPVDHEEHREWHDHQGAFYTPHRFGRRTPGGHALEFNDHPGKAGRVRLADRFGRLLEMTAEGIVRLRSAFNSAFPTRFHQLVLADGYNEGEDADAPDAGQYAELRDAAGQALRLHATEGAEYVLLRDAALQTFRLHAVQGEERVEIVDAVGQMVRLNPTAGIVTVKDGAGNLVELKDGKVTVTSNGHVTLNVLGGKNVHIGGEGGKALATVDFVNTIYKTHTHPTPTGPSGPPVLKGTETAWPQVTQKGRSE